MYSLKEFGPQERIKALNYNTGKVQTMGKCITMKTAIQGCIELIESETMSLQKRKGKNPTF